MWPKISLVPRLRNVSLAGGVREGLKEAMQNWGWKYNFKIVQAGYREAKGIAGKEWGICQSREAWNYASAVGMFEPFWCCFSISGRRSCGMTLKQCVKFPFSSSNSQYELECKLILSVMIILFAGQPVNIPSVLKFTERQLYRNEAGRQSRPTSSPHRSMLVSSQWVSARAESHVGEHLNTCTEYVFPSFCINGPWYSVSSVVSALEKWGEAACAVVLRVLLTVIQDLQPMQFASLPCYWTNYAEWFPPLYYTTASIWLQ